MQKSARGLVAFLPVTLCSALAGAQETVWVEAEWLHGITGYCWPMGKPEVRKTNGHWGLSGPGWAAEWTQGGESMFMSIACGGFALVRAWPDQFGRHQVAGTCPWWSLVAVTGVAPLLWLSRFHRRRSRKIAAAAGLCPQ